MVEFPLRYAMTDSDDVLYFDHNSSAPLAPEALAAMLPYLERRHGNAASQHVLGRELASAVADARVRLAGLIGADAEEVVFTGGGTESNNWALDGTLRTRGGGHVVISSVEHFSVAAAARRLADDRRATLDVVAVDGIGRVDPQRVAAALRPETVLVSILLAQNEVGTVQPIAEIAGIARRRGITVHCDASQAVGKYPVDVQALGVDLLTIAGHKLYGPKGIGALFIRRGVEIAPWMLGAPHENGRRAGTSNVPGIVGLGAAAEVARRHLPTEVPRQRALVERFFAELELAWPGVAVNGAPLADSARLPGTLNVSFPGIRGDEFLARLPGLAATPGAACHSGDPRPSATLMAMGLPLERALGAVRFSIGRATTVAEIDRAAEMIRNLSASPRPA